MSKKKHREKRATSKQSIIKLESAPRSELLPHSSLSKRAHIRIAEFFPQGWHAVNKSTKTAIRHHQIIDASAEDKLTQRTYYSDRTSIIFFHNLKSHTAKTSRLSIISAQLELTNAFDWNIQFF